MNQTLRAGDRIKHQSKPEWGIGEILKISNSGETEVFFDDIGYKLFASTAASKFVLVEGDEAKSDYLTRLIASHRARAEEPSTTARGKQSSRRVLRSFSTLVAVMRSASINRG